MYVSINVWNYFNNIWIVWILTTNLYSLLGGWKNNKNNSQHQHNILSGILSISVHCKYKYYPYVVILFVNNYVTLTDNVYQIASVSFLDRCIHYSLASSSRTFSILSDFIKHIFMNQLMSQFGN